MIMKKTYLAWLIAVSCGATSPLMAQETQDQSADKTAEEKRIEEVLTIGYSDSIKRSARAARVRRYYQCSEER